MFHWHLLVLELAVAQRSVSGGAAQVAVEAAVLNAGSEHWASWAVPLAAGALAAAVPTPAPHLWQQAQPSNNLVPPTNLAPTALGPPRMG